MTREATKFWFRVIAAVAILFWINFWLGIAAVSIIAAAFIAATLLAFNGFRGS